MEFSLSLCTFISSHFFVCVGVCGCSVVLQTKYLCSEQHRTLLMVHDGGDLKEIIRFFDPPSGTQIKVSLPAQYVVKMKVATLYMEMSCFHNVIKLSIYQKQRQ